MTAAKKKIAAKALDDLRAVARDLRNAEAHAESGAAAHRFEDRDKRYPFVAGALGAIARDKASTVDAIVARLADELGLVAS